MRHFRHRAVLPFFYTEISAKFPCHDDRPGAVNTTRFPSTAAPELNVRTPAAQRHKRTAQTTDQEGVRGNPSRVCSTWSV
jgi:hypothetical protein